MLCESCQKNPAMVHLTHIVGGKVEKLHLCKECAELQGLDVHAQPVDLSNILMALKEQLGQLQGKLPPKPRSGAATCEGCGMTRTQALKSGRLGCDRCYETFTEDLASVVLSLQHAVEHSGKMPRRAAPELKASVEIARLQRELEKAVAGEAYEQAAQLRDKIKAIATEVEGGEA